MLPAMSLSRRRTLCAFAGALLSAAVPLAHAADAFPTRPVRIISSFPPGAGPEVALRVIAEQLSKKWKQPVVVDNRPGGNGFVAIGALKQAKPDGYDLLQIDMAHVVTHPYTFNNLPYDPRLDLTPITPLFSNEFFVAVAKDSPYKTVDDIVAAARARPGLVTYGSWFTGSPGHLGALRLESATGTRMLHVPYREMSQLYGNVSTKEVEWALGSAASAGALERGGKLRFIATTGTKKSSVYPDLPLMSEAKGAAGVSLVSWTGLAAPRDTPKALREQIAADVSEVLKSPEVQERFKAMGYDATPMTPDQMTALIEREREAWSKIISAANLKLD